MNFSTPLLSYYRLYFIYELWKLLLNYYAVGTVMIILVDTYRATEVYRKVDSKN